MPRVSWLALHNVWFSSLIGQGNGRDLRIHIKIYGKLASNLDSAGIRPWGWGGDEQSCPLLIMMWKATPGGSSGSRGQCGSGTLISRQCPWILCPSMMLTTPGCSLSPLKTTNWCWCRWTDCIAFTVLKAPSIYTCHHTVMHTTWAPTQSWPQHKHFWQQTHKPPVHPPHVGLQSRWAQSTGALQCLLHSQQRKHQQWGTGGIPTHCNILSWWHSCKNACPAHQ